MADDDVLNELRRYPGWRTFYPDLDGLAEQVARLGRLQEACDAAHLRFGAAWSGSSNSSGVAVAFTAIGRVEDVEVFLGLLRQELLAVLMTEPWP